MIANIYADLNNLIQNETRAREESEEKFIALLEQTCAKIENNMGDEYE